LASRIGQSNWPVERTWFQSNWPVELDLETDDCGAFGSLRAQLKTAGCRVVPLDDAIDEENGGMGRREPTQADILR
jgi:hypothetical protein